MGKIFCIEGEHCVGKGYLLEKMQAHTVNLPVVRDSEFPEFQNLIASIREGKISDPKDIIEKVAIMRGQVYRRHIARVVESTPAIILDRYYYTSAVWQADENNSVESIIKRNLQEEIPTPDKTFVIDASLSTVLQRMRARNRDDDERYLANSKKIYTHLKRFRQLIPHYTECVIIRNETGSDALETMLSYM